MPKSHSVLFHLMKNFFLFSQAYSPIPSKKSKRDRSRSPTVDREKQADWLQSLAASANKVRLIGSFFRFGDFYFFVMFIRVKFYFNLLRYAAQCLII